MNLHHSHGPNSPPTFGSDNTNAQDEYTRIQSIMEISSAIEIASVDDRKTEDEIELIDSVGVRTEFERLSQLAIPMVITYTLEIFPDVVSVVLVGHIRSPNTPALVDGAMLSIMWTEVSAMSIGFGLSSALDSLCSQAFGAAQYSRIGIYLQCGVIVISISCLPVFFLNWYTEPILAELGVDLAIARYAGEFSRCTVFGLPSLFGFELLRKTFHAQNITRPFVAISVIQNILNLGTGYYLTYHSPMGLRGAAVARTFANLVLPFLCVPYFRWNRDFHCRWWPGWDLREAWRHMSLFVELGIPSFLMMALRWWAFEVMALMAGLLPNGVVSVSAHAVLVNLSSIFYMMFTGISTAGNVLMGNALGANQPHRARLICRITIVTSFSVGIILSSLMISFRHEIPTLLINEHASITIVSSSVMVFAFYEAVEGVNCALQSLSSQSLATKASAIAIYFVGIPLAIYAGFVLQWDVHGLWLGFAIGMLSSAALCSLALRKVDWQQMANKAMDRVYWSGEAAQ